VAGPELILHGLAPSHPCLTVEAALRYKGLAYERIDFTPGQHVAEMQRIYGEGKSTVPGLLIDGEPVHSSRAILAALEEMVPAPTLYPEAIAGAVREAERWGDEELQDLGRRLPWGALHFRPDALAAEGIIGGEEPTAADLQIASTLRILLVVGDLRPLLAGRPAQALARRWFPDYAGDIPAGAYPAGWVPAREP